MYAGNKSELEALRHGIRVGILQMKATKATRREVDSHLVFGVGRAADVMERDSKVKRKEIEGGGAGT